MSDADLGLEYRGGIAAPAAEEIGFTPRAIASVADEPSVLEYPPDQQTLAGAGTWDGRARSVAVGGSGARAIAVPNGSHTGQSVWIIDAAGNSAAGNITIDPAGAGTINGAATLVLSSNFACALLQYTATNTWIRLT